ncbi:MAG: S-DNA-T family DNA segregation ATPase FtsK/SpoIIIE [Planctomycetota bacterium]|jgi:S-DNA-T family DNA segregation ATPase FtsK/SpoIIIE
MARSKSGKKKAGRKASKKGSKKGPGLLTRTRDVLAGFVLGSEVEEETAEHFQEIKGLVLFGIALWLGIALVSYYAPPDVAAAEGKNWGGQAGYFIATWVFMAMGWSGYLLVFLGIAWSCILVARKQVVWPTLRIFGALCLLASTAFLFQLGFGELKGNELPYGPGGWLALELAGPNPINPDGTSILVSEFGGPGAWLLLSIAALISFMLATEMAFYNAAIAMRDWFEERRSERDESVAAAAYSWFKNLCAGLWEFLKGPEPEVVVTPTKAAKQAAKKAANKKAAAKKTKAAKKKEAEIAALFVEADDEVEAEAEEDEYEDEAEEEEDEWEYVDEDGNPIDEDDEEYEYEDGEEDEEEVEEEELVPARSKTRKTRKGKRGHADDEEEEDEEEEEPAPRTMPKPQLQKALVFEPPTPPAGPWKFPPISLLEPPAKSEGTDASKVEESARKLENALASFRVEATVVGAKVGPTVTLYELEVSQGTRMNKVTALTSEISAALRAKSVRIIAPIPGKATIGVEVPNSGERLIVRLSQLITKDAYDKKFAALPMFLGMDTEGEVIVADLARMPHLLIAGTTGSGKSVCINTILASILLTRSPHDVQLILVDPKMVELMMFSKVPHLMLPVVTDPKQATNVLNWTVEKMEGRYELFKIAKVKNIKTFNALGEESLRERMGDEFNEDRTPRHVPYIVVVIDEMADLMMTAKKEAEHAITRLAQKSRAVGIHVIVATQRPSTDVITGVIKGNLPTRIAFQVASKIDSRVILDASGAENLLGQGDMLYTPPQASQLKRVQGALVEDHELQALVDFVTLDSAPAFSQEMVQTATGSRPPGTMDGADQDEMWDDAVRVILKSRRGSASLLQRALGVGYTRASRLIDMMTQAGIVGEHKGSKAREVLMTLEDWEEMNGAPMGCITSDD